MSNPFRGEATLGDTRLQLDVNAVIEAEEETGESIDAVLTRASEVGPGQLRAMRLVIWVMMKRHQPDATLEDAGGLINAHGPQAVAATLGRVLSVQGGAAEGEVGNAPAPARKAPARKAARRKAG